MNVSQRTPLHVAAEAGHANVAKLLIMHDANINAAYKLGCSPLTKAAEQDHN